MSRFSDFVRKYAARADISAQDFDGCVGELARAVRSRLEALGMFSQPPAYFGYPEFDSWERALDLREGPTDPVLDALDYAITARLDTLAERIETGVTNIDGLVRLNVNHFLYERQRAQDPIGHAVFENLEAALLRLGDAGVLRFEGLVDGKVRNPTVLRFGAGPTRAASGDDLAAALDADAELARLYPHLAHANVKAQAVLAALLPALNRARVGACMVRDLVNALKERVHSAWASRNRPADNEAVPRSTRPTDCPELIRIVSPDSRYADREGYEAFLRRAREGIARLPQERTRRGVARLLEEVVRYREVDEELPPVEELGRRLGVAKSTAHEHMQKLREILREAHESP